LCSCFQYQSPSQITAFLSAECRCRRSSSAILFSGNDSTVVRQPVSTPSLLARGDSLRGYRRPSVVGLLFRTRCRYRQYRRRRPRFIHFDATSACDHDGTDGHINAIGLANTARSIATRCKTYGKYIYNCRYARSACLEAVLFTTDLSLSTKFKSLSVAS